jgi:hypothetical protein
MADEYKRLLAWARETSRDLNVTQTVDAWAIAVSIQKPVQYKAYASGATLDDAANKIVRDLESVSAGRLEDIPKDPSPFGVA